MRTHSYVLTLSHGVFTRCVGDLLAQPGRSFLLSAGVGRLPDRTELLVADLPHSDATANPNRPTLLIRAATSPEGLVPPMGSGFGVSTQEAAVLTIGIGPVAGRFTAVCSSRAGWSQIELVRVVGPGMPSLHFSRGQPESIPSGEDEIWSRTIGALGRRTWESFRNLHIAIMGCGRSGSLVANSLARFGLRQLTLIDADHVEIHNVGEMDLATFADLGSSKVEALRAHVLQTAAHVDVICVADSAISLRGLAAFKRADLVVSCVDNGVARLTTAILARLYLRPFLDVGTGVFGRGPERVMGADVRLVAPDRCLLCFGGLADEAAARTGFLRAGAGQQGPPTPAWNQQRAGSLRSLNQTAVGIGLRMLEDFVDARIADSTWIHLSFSADGIPSVEQRLPTADPACRICRLAGRGDDGIPALQQALDAARR